jgi:hypothetical protein
MLRHACSDEADHSEALSITRDLCGDTFSVAWRRTLSVPADGSVYAVHLITCFLQCSSIERSVVFDALFSRLPGQC